MLCLIFVAQLPSIAENDYNIFKFFDELNLFFILYLKVSILRNNFGSINKKNLFLSMYVSKHIFCKYIMLTYFDNYTWNVFLCNGFKHNITPRLNINKFALLSKTWLIKPVNISNKWFLTGIITNMYSKKKTDFKRIHKGEKRDNVIN